MEFNRNDARDAAREKQERDRVAAQTQQQRDTERRSEQARSEQARSEHQQAVQGQITAQQAAKSLAADLQRDKQKQAVDQTVQKQRLAAQQRSRVGELKRPDRPDNASQIAYHKQRVAQLAAREQAKVAVKDVHKSGASQAPGMPVGSFSSPNDPKSMELNMLPPAEIQRAGVDSAVKDVQRDGEKQVLSKHAPDRSISLSDARHLMNVAGALGITAKDPSKAADKSPPTKEDVHRAVDIAQRAGCKASVVDQLKAAEKEASPAPVLVREAERERDSGR